MDEKTRQVEGNGYRYVVDRTYMQTDRHGRSFLSLDGHKSEPKLGSNKFLQTFILHLKWRR